MQNLLKPLLFLLLSISIVACDKDLTENKLIEKTVIASKNKAIKIGEPVSFKTSLTSASIIDWTVSPSSKANIASNGKNASILFTSPGNYTVNATSGNSRLSSSVSVIDSLFSSPDTYSSTPFVAGEQLDVTVSKKDTLAGSRIITIFQFFVKTTKNYNCPNSILRPNITFPSEGINISFANVFMPNGCNEGTNKALTYFTIFNEVSSFSINFNNKKYSGSIVKEGSKFAIKWPYSSGVMISPSIL